MKRVLELLSGTGRQGHIAWRDSTTLLAIWNNAAVESVHQRVTSFCDGPDNNRVAIIADARLDNRKELAAQLGIDPTAAPVSDSELLALSYRKWGKQMPRHFLGDFSYILWDEATGSLHGACDQLGVRQLYYFVYSGLVTISDDISFLLRSWSDVLRLDHSSLAAYLSFGEFIDESMTCFAGLKKLPSANSLYVHKGQVGESRYWAPEEIPESSSTSLDECSEQLRALLEASVEARIDTGSTIGCHLSGGLDSSVVAAITARLQGDRGEKLRTYSWMNESGDAAAGDNAEWLRGLAVAQYLGIPHQAAGLQEAHILGMLREHDIGDNDTVDLVYEFLVRDNAAGQGVDVLLSGWGGDQLITSSGKYAYAELLFSGGPLQAYRKMQEDYRTPGFAVPPGRSLVYREILKPLLSIAKQRLSGHITPGFLGAAEASVADIARKTYLKREAPARISSRKNQLAMLRSGYIQSRLASWASSGRELNIEYRYPLLDRRIVEFALSLPGWMYRSGSRKRFIFRKAAADYLPEKTIWMETKQEPNRVQRLLQLESRALKQLAAGDSQFWERPPGDPGSVIDLDKLHQLIASLPEEDGEQLLDRAHDIDVAVKSVFALRAGHSLRGKSRKLTGSGQFL